MTEIMESKVSYSSISQCGPEGSADTLKRSALVGENVVIRQTTNLSQALEGCANVWRHGNTSACFRLGLMTAKGDESPTEVNMVPGQRHNLPESLAQLVGR